MVSAFLPSSFREALGRGGEWMGCEYYRCDASDDWLMGGHTKQAERLDRLPDIF